MSMLTLPESKMDRISDWMNPILVKETRQALKSRSFVATFMLLLIASWLIVMFGVAAAGSSLEYGTPSLQFLQAFYFVLSAAVLVIVPFTAYRGLLSEQDSQTYELLSITSLTPRQIVLGKLANSVVQILVFYSAIAPFVAFTSLLQGFDLFATLTLLATLLGVSILLCTFTLMLSTLAKNRQVQTLSSLFVVGGLVIVFSSMSGFSFALLQGEFDPDREFFIGLGCTMLVGVSYFFLFLQVTISQLMYESGNRSTGVRLIATGQLVLVWLLLFLVETFGSGLPGRGFVEFVTILSLIHWGVLGFFCTMERDDLSRRIRRDMPRSGILRFLLVPFMPGGTRGYLLFLMGLTMLFGMVKVMEPLVSLSLTDEIFLACGAAAGYLVIYFGLGSFLSRRMLRISNELKPMHARTILIILFVIGMITPHLILTATGYYDSYNVPYSLVQITDPLSTINEIQSSRYIGGVFELLLIGSLTMIVFNLPAMLIAAKQILVPDRPAPKETVTADPHLEAQPATA